MPGSGGQGAGWEVPNYCVSYCASILSSQHISEVSTIIPILEKVRLSPEMLGDLFKIIQLGCDKADLRTCIILTQGFMPFPT